MGAWDTGIFDNDNAADFAGSIEHCSDVEARQDLLTATMGAVLDRMIREEEITDEYEMGYELEMALAAAAFVADARNGTHEFTDTAYAMGHDHSKEYDDPAYWYHLDVGTPSDRLVGSAVLCTEKILNQMIHRRIDMEWREPIEKLYDALMRQRQGS